MGLGFDYVWVLITPSNEVFLYKSQELAEASLPQSRSRIEISTFNYEYKVGTQKYHLSCKKIRGSAGIQ